MDSAAARADDVAFLGHPRGLFYLAFTEAWERFSFYGMTALLTLYMVNQLLLPGHVEQIAGFAAFRAAVESIVGPLSMQALASQIFGLYAGFVYFTPLLGGMIADRWIGQRNGVVIGALSMSAGHIAMTFDQSFLVALLLLVIGSGFLKGNISAQVGALYPPEDEARRTRGFVIFSTGINIGAVVGPLLCGLLAQVYGWHYGFGFAGFGMLIGLIVYLRSQRYLPPQQVRVTGRPRTPLDDRERRVIAVLIALTPLAALFWVAQTQVWNVYNVWVRDHVNLNIAGWTMPVPWLQSIDGLAPLASMPLALMFWRWQAGRGREPDEFGKLGRGCLLFGLSTAWLAAGHVAFPGGAKIPLLWAIAFHLMSNVGWLYFAPTAVAVFAKAAPASVNALMIGTYNLAVFAGGIVSGRLGSLYERLDPKSFWLLHAAIVAAGGVLLLVLAPVLRRELRPADALSSMPVANAELGQGA
jgi:POT family proton-dependent oligopeptide transporter